MAIFLSWHCLWKFQAIYQVTVLLVLNFDGKRILRLEHDSSEHAKRVKNTLIFNAFVLSQVSCYYSNMKLTKIDAVGLNIL